MKSFFTAIATLLMLVSIASAEFPSSSQAVTSQAISSGKPTLINFGLRTCNVCKKMAPYLESLSNEYRGKAHILFVDVRADMDVARKFRVQMLPTQLFINAQGKEVQRHTGFMDKDGMIKGLKLAGLK